MKTLVYHPEIYNTKNGTSYLREAGVVVLCVPDFNIDPVQGFLAGFDKEAGFDPEYIEDAYGTTTASERLIKTTGQLCYMSFGAGRTKNADMAKYLDNIKSSGHGSVLEHANVTVLIYGVGRDFTHELVRHRAGFAYSQVSQRYVDGKALRFVERIEFQKDEALHERFESRIDAIRQEYDETAAALQRTMAKALEGKPKTEARKAVNQAARACLPNETEAPIVATANMRAWRHAIDMRASKYADTPIRAVFVRVCEMLKQVAPTLMSDHAIIDLPDGTRAVEATYRKV